MSNMSLRSNCLGIAVKSLGLVPIIDVSVMEAVEQTLPIYPHIIAVISISIRSLQNLRDW